MRFSQKVLFSLISIIQSVGDSIEEKVLSSVEGATLAGQCCLDNISG